MLQVEELVKQGEEAFSQVALVVYRLLFLFAVHSVSVKQPAIEERLTYLTHASTQPHYHHYRHDNFFVIFIHFILKCMIKQNFIEQRFMAVLSTFHYRPSHLYLPTSHAATFLVFGYWSITCFRRFIFSQQTRGMHRMSQKWPFFIKFHLSNLKLSVLISLTNLHVILSQSSPQTVASNTVTLLLLLAKRSAGEIFIESKSKSLRVRA